MWLGCGIAVRRTHASDRESYRANGARQMFADVLAV